MRRGYYQTRDLYSARSAGPYFYLFGFHWRGYTAYICGILINIVGFVGAIGVDVPVGAAYIYNVNFFAGLLVAGGTYWALCRLSPIPATSDRWCEIDDYFEQTRGGSVAEYVVNEEVGADSGSDAAVGKEAGMHVSDKSAHF